MTTFTEEMQLVITNLETREWIQGIEQDDKGRVCAHGAVMTCQGLRPGDKHIIRSVMRARGLTEGYNDADGRTKYDVLTKMRLIEVTDADLEFTFGSSWREVIAVIRRISVLTVDEINSLETAWDAAWDAAWWSARAAAWAASRDAAWDAAWAAARAASRDAAWVASRDAAWDAAWAAALAAVTADLVGQSGYTRQHYDTLIGPWISVLGSPKKLEAIETQTNQ